MFEILTPTRWKKGIEQAIEAVQVPHNRTWDDVIVLFDQLSQLADNHFGIEKDCSIWVYKGHVRVTITIDRIEFKGEGKDPWEAVQDIANKSNKVAAALGKLNNQS